MARETGVIGKLDSGRKSPLRHRGRPQTQMLLHPICVNMGNLRVHCSRPAPLPARVFRASAYEIVQNEPNLRGSFKFEVSSVKSGKPALMSSDFRLYTSHFKLLGNASRRHYERPPNALRRHYERALRAKQSQFAEG
jgi:hypothetical protein